MQEVQRRRQLPPERKGLLRVEPSVAANQGRKARTLDVLDLDEWPGALRIHVEDSRETLSSSDAGEVALGGKQLAGSDDLSRMQLTICTGAQVHTAKAHQSGASCQLFAPGRKGWWRAPWTSEYERVLIGPSPAVLMPCSSPRARRPSCGSAPPRPAPRPTSPSPLRTPTSWPASHASPRRAELRRRRGQARLVERPSAADRPRAPAVPARRACQWVSVSDRSPAPAGAFRRWVAAESSWTRPMQHPCRRTGQNHPLPRKKVMAPTTASVMSPSANG